jgi:rare lipoprotein A
MLIDPHRHAARSASAERKGSAMAWQRFLRVGIYAAALASLACADGRALESAAQPGDAVPAAAPKKPIRSAKQGKTHHRVKVHHRARTKPSHAKAGQLGYASWYGRERHGMTMANGGSFDITQFTAAHRTLPLHSKARVTNVENGRSVTVRITDRGPSRKGRIIDLSQSAAEEIGMRQNGVARVRVEPIAAGAAP